MKKLTFTILFSLLSFNLYAGDDVPVFVVSPIQPQPFTGISPPPVENEEFRLWIWSFIDTCVNPIDEHVDYNSFHIDIFIQRVHNSPCLPIISTVYDEAATISPLAEGIYTLSVYYVPNGVNFPPAPVDYGTYFVETIEFEVFAAPPTIDATSNFSIAMLIFMLMLSGFYFSNGGLSKKKV